MSTTHDFDFLVGHWAIANRRRTAAGTWDEFPATSTVASHVDGRVQLDHYDAPAFPGRGHVKALTVRSFDEVARQWSLVWLANYSTPDPRPVVGAWDGDRGAFFLTLGEDEPGGPLELRFDWTRDGAADTARWSQSVRGDGGGWELDWVMDLTRAG
jgi:hypothetical protein